MKLDTLKSLLEIDSPSGFTEKACQYISEVYQSYGYETELNNKGALKCKLGENPILALSAHTDTLGAMVKEVQNDGTLRISNLGGLKLQSVEGEYVRIYTASGKVYSGIFRIDNPAVHNNREIATLPRKYDNMHIDLDEIVENEKDVSKLGIEVGDFVCFEVNYQETKSGFVKSRFLDNKSGCYILMELAKHYKGKNIPVELVITSHEEVGHGGSTGFSPSMEELLVLDMAVVGEGCAGKETHCSVCAKDSTGPYDFGFRTRLVALAKEQKIPYKVDIYPYYGSDGSAALRAGYDAKVALIGPGVSASHGSERTHRNGIKATLDLCIAYIDDRFGL